MAATDTCTFCAIARGDLEAEVVYRDDTAVAFLDHRPLFHGHTLVIPREHHVTLSDLPTSLIEPFFGVVQRLARVVEAAMEAEGSFVAMNNVVSQSVPHLHAHVVPRRRKDGLRGFFWPRSKYGSPEQMAEVGERLRAALSLWHIVTEQVRLQTSDGLSLEGELAAPESPVAALVLCHPHPQMGGTMNAPLLTGLEGRMNTLGWAVLRFNFRGLGSSEGEFGLGIDEMKDAAAAVEFVRERFPDLPVAIAGWSFGAAVAVRVALERDDLLACVAIAPAIAEKPGVTAGIPASTDVTLNLPLLMIVGANDHLIDPDACKQWAEATGAQCTVVPGANHFFWAKYDDLNDLVAAYLQDHIL